MNLLVQAIVDNDVKGVDLFISSRLVDVNARLPVENNPPPLVFGAKRGCLEIVERLLNAGAQIDGVDDERNTACHVVEQSDVLALLLAHRPNLTLQNGAGLTSLQVHLRTNHNEHNSTMLIAAGAPFDLHVDADGIGAFAGSSTSAIQTLINRGVTISELRDSYGNTPLHHATHNVGVSLDVLSMLINVCGVPLDERRSNGFTCTELAAFFGFAAPLRFFIAAGGEVNNDSNAELSPLYFTTSSSDYECTVMLLAAGADVHVRDQFGNTLCDAWGIELFIQS